MASVTTSVDRTSVAGLLTRPEKSRVSRKSRTVRYLAGFGTGASYGVHEDNQKNMARGIAERVLYVPRDGGLARAPQPLRGVFGVRLKSIRQRLLGVLTPTPVVERRAYADLYVGRKQEIYRRAAESLAIRAINPRDAYTSTFLKAEKVNFDKKPDPAPRVIQPRSPRYNLEVGRYLKLFEKRLFAGFRSVFGYPVILKGMNASETAGWLHRHWSEMAEPVAIGLDASRFDQHVSIAALRWEHGIYNSVFQSDELARLLRWQLVNHGIARTSGVRMDYWTQGCRMSGDINTSLGNCLIMSSIVIAYCEHVGVKFRLANNGDDCVLIVERSEISRLDGIDQWFLEFGFTLTREPVVSVFEQIEFCQAQPVYTGSGWRMVRNIYTAMSKDCVSLLSWNTEKDFQSWAHAIGSCGLSLTEGVPVWEQWYRRLIAIGCEGPGGVVERVRESGSAFMASGVVGCEVTAESRVSFYKAFGVTPDQQLALESEYRQPVTVSLPTPMTTTQSKAIDQQFNSLLSWLAGRRRLPPL